MYMYDVLYGEVKDVLSAKTIARPSPPPPPLLSSPLLSPRISRSVKQFNRLQFAILYPLDLQTYQHLHYIYQLCLW